MEYLHRYHPRNGISAQPRPADYASRLEDGGESPAPWRTPGISFCEDLTSHYLSPSLCAYRTYFCSPLVKKANDGRPRYAISARAGAWTSAQNYRRSEHRFTVSLLRGCFALSFTCMSHSQHKLTQNVSTASLCELNPVFKKSRQRFSPENPITTSSATCFRSRLCCCQCVAQRETFKASLLCKPDRTL